MNKFLEDKRRIDFFNENSTKCNCGHTNFLGSRDKIICSWCGKYVFKNEKIKFLHRIGELLKNDFNKQRID